jgi:hypothetical protein
MFLRLCSAAWRILRKFMGGEAPYDSTGPGGGQGRAALDRRNEFEIMLFSFCSIGNSRIV